MIRKILLSLLLSLAVQCYGQFNSIGMYAGYGSDKRSNSYDFRMKPVFELGVIYNQPIFFNLSLEMNLGYNSQRIVTEGSSAGYIPPEANYGYFNADVMFRYWLVNDIRGFMTGKRSNNRVKADIAQSPINFYLTGGLLNEFLVVGAADEAESFVVSGALGAGVNFYMPISTKFEGVSPFIEVLSTRNLTPRFISGTEELKFSRWVMRVGLTYSFSPGKTNPFF